MKALPVLALVFGTLITGSAHAVLTGKCSGLSCMQIPAEYRESEKEPEKVERSREANEKIPAGVENSDLEN